MKQKVKVFENDKQIYKGRLIELPIKEQYIIKKSIELFDDEDPCIIHQSFVYKEYASQILDLLNESPEKTLYLKDHEEELSFINYKDLSAIKIVLQ
jgi:hypothetical protein